MLAMLQGFVCLQMRFVSMPSNTACVCACVHWTVWFYLILNSAGKLRLDSSPSMSFDRTPQHCNNKAVMKKIGAKTKYSECNSALCSLIVNASEMAC